MFDTHHLPNPIPDEKVIYLLRRHPYTLFPLVLGMIAIFLIPAFLYLYLQETQPEFLLNPIGMPLLVLGGSAFFLLTWLFLFQNFMDYFLDVWIITTRRILNIEHTGLFSRTVSELRMYRIQDVTATVQGAIQTLFDYGEVEIQTAGERQHFLCEEIPHPNAVAKTILELAEIDRREHLDEAVEEFGFAERKNHT